MFEWVTYLTDKLSCSVKVDVFVNYDNIQWSYTKLGSILDCSRTNNHNYIRVTEFRKSEHQTTSNSKPRSQIFALDVTRH